MKLPSLLKISSLFVISFVLIIIFPVNSSATSLRKGDLIINEINWGGSTLSSNDEWVELFNNTESDINLTGTDLSVKGSGNPVIFPLDGIIKAKSYYVFSELGIDTSVISIANKINSKLTISNSSFQIKLQQGTTVIDEVNTNGKAPFAGSSDTGKKASMAKVSPELEGNDPLSWKTTVSRKNLRKGAEFCQNFGTPGAENFSASGETVFEFEDSCTSGLKYSPDKNSIIIDSTTDASSLNQINFDFGKEAQAYEIEINGNYSNNTVLKDGDKILSVNIDFNDDYDVTLGVIQARQLRDEREVVFSFVKPTFLTTASIELVPNLKSDQSIELDKLIIRKIFNGGSMEAPYVINSPHGSIYSTDEIDPGTKRTFKTVYKAQINGNISSLNPLTKVAALRTTNPFTKTIWEKNIYYKDLTESGFQVFTNIFIADTFGFDVHEFITYGNTDFSLSSLAIEPEASLEKQTLSIADMMQSGVNYSYNNQERSLSIENRLNKPAKIIGLGKSSLCILYSTCKLKVPVRVSNFSSDDPELQIIDLSLSGTAASGAKYQTIQHLKKKDLSQNIFEISLDYPNVSNLYLGLYSYNNADLEVGDIDFVQEKNDVKSQILFSRKNINWSGLVDIEPDTQRSSVIDILDSRQLIDSGNYSLIISAQRNGKSNTGADVLKISAYDDTGRKLSEQVIEENDLSEFKPVEFKGDFELSKPQNVKVIIRYNPNEEEDISGIKISKIELVKR